LKTKFEPRKVKFWDLERALPKHMTGLHRLLPKEIKIITTSLFLNHNIINIQLNIMHYILLHIYEGVVSKEEEQL